MSFTANGKQVTPLPSTVKDSKMDAALFEPKPLEKSNWLIHLYHVRGAIDDCKKLIQSEINESKGKNEYAYFKQGIIFREEGRIQEALQSFQICHKLNGDNTENLKEVAKCLFLLKRYRLSLQAFLEAERNASKPDWEIYHNICQCLMCLGEVNKAKEYARKAAQLGKQETSYTLLIKILIDEGDLESAVAACRSALDSCPDSTSLLTKSGILYLKLGKTQQAFENLSSALAIDPSCSTALVGVGCITQAHEEYDVALAKYKIALQVNPDSVALWNNIGMCFYSKQKYVAAISCLKRALWLSPLNWRVLLNLGLVHLSMLQPASAFNFLCAAVNLRPDVGLSFMALGCALFELKDLENSLRAFRQSVLLSKNDPLVALNTSVTLMVNGLYDEALEFLEIFKNNAEGNKHVEKKLWDLESRLNVLLSQQSHKTVDNKAEDCYKEGKDQNDIDKEGYENKQSLENVSQEQCDSNLSRVLQPDEV